MRDKYKERRAKRLRLNSPALLRNGSGSRVKATLFDISKFGCALSVDGIPLSKGRIYSLKIDGLELLTGTVIWVRGRYAGLEFADPLHAAVAESLAKESGIPSDNPGSCGDDLLVAMVRDEAKVGRAFASSTGR